MIETGRKKFLRKSKEIKNRMPNHVEEMGLGRKLTDKLKSHRIEYVGYPVMHREGTAGNRSAE